MINRPLFFYAKEAVRRLPSRIPSSSAHFNNPVWYSAVVTNELRKSLVRTQKNPCSGSTTRTVLNIMIILSSS